MSFLTRYTEANSPNWYYVIGRLKNIPPIARNRADELLHTAHGEFSIALLERTAPDGIVLQRGCECFVTRRGRLELFDPLSAGWTNHPQTQPEPELTPLEWAKTIQEAKRMAAWWEAHYYRERI